MANTRLDLIIFGATGFTGKYVVKEAVRCYKEQQLKFGIAGRRKEALDAVIKEFAPDIDVPVILADVKDEESLTKMTEQAKVIVDCCGPYRFYGEPVVKACIATRTHYVDISGEPQFIETMQLKYNKAAQEAGVYIVSACGFDSIPVDLGISFIQKKFGGQVNSVETYLKTWTTGDAKGAQVNYGTWESLIYGVSHMNDLRELRKKLYPTKLPEFLPKLKQKGLHKSDISEGWSIKFAGADRPVALRSQRFLYDYYNERPLQIHCYFTLPSLFSLISISIFAIIFYSMVFISWGRNLLLKYPALFSGGFVTREGPKAETLEHTHFSIMFKARGWSEKLSETTDKHTNPPNKDLIAKVSGDCPGYGATAIMLILSAVTILKENDKMPDNGGVLPPGAAFGKTSLIEELNKRDIKFEIISSIEK